MILILSREDDEHVRFVIRGLKAQCARHIWLDPALFPVEIGIRICCDRKGKQCRTFHFKKRTLNLDEVTAVWMRRPGNPRPAEEITDPELRTWTQEECKNLLTGLWEGLDCLWVPGKPLAYTLGYNKGYHIGLAAKCGFRVPQTVFTNRPGDFVSFYHQTRGRLVSKVMLNNYIPHEDSNSVAFTHAVRRRDAAHCHSIRYSPVILQEYVPKDVELRITVVDSRVFAAEIRSQASHRTKHDWRHYDDERATYAPHKLPEAVCRSCIRLVRALGLCFGTIDMVLTPGGEYVFLEINPNGQWLWIESLTQLPISAALVDLLIRGAA